jgi:hypothetical protein
MSISEDIENNLGFSEKMYIPEQVVIEWLNLSAIITTYSLVFYNMARSGSIKIHPYLAIFISISLILISTAYMIYSLIPYSKRMTFLANTCKKSKECSDEQYKHITSITNVYLFLGGLTSVIQLIVTYLIITTV